MLSIEAVTRAIYRGKWGEARSGATSCEHEEARHLSRTGAAAAVVIGEVGEVGAVT